MRADHPHVLVFVRERQENIRKGNVGSIALSPFF